MAQDATSNSFLYLFILFSLSLLLPNLPSLAQYVTYKSSSLFKSELKMSSSVNVWQKGGKWACCSSLCFTVSSSHSLEAGFERLPLLVPIKTHMFLLAYIFYWSFFSTSSGKGVQVSPQLHAWEGERVLQNWGWVFFFFAMTDINYGKDLSHSQGSDMCAPPPPRMLIEPSGRWLLERSIHFSTAHMLYAVDLFSEH